MEFSNVIYILYNIKILAHTSIENVYMQLTRNQKPNYLHTELHTFVTQSNFSDNFSLKLFISI